MSLEYDHVPGLYYSYPNQFQAEMALGLYTYIWLASVEKSELSECSLPSWLLTNKSSIISSASVNWVVQRAFSTRTLFGIVEYIYQIKAILVVLHGIRNAVGNNL